jgi:hypothetical protein
LRKSGALQYGVPPKCSAFGSCMTPWQSGLGDSGVIDMLARCSTNLLATRGALRPSAGALGAGAVILEADTRTVAACGIFEVLEWGQRTVAPEARRATEVRLTSTLATSRSGGGDKGATAFFWSKNPTVEKASAVTTGVLI